jgi:hypothetical protein
MKLRSKKLLVLPLAITAATGGTALAVVTGSAGGNQLQMINRSDNVPTTTASTAFTDIPGASSVLVVPAGTTQLVNARFTAESHCSRAQPALGGWCSVRIVAQRIGGAATELSPVAGSDYAFDSVSTDQHEGNAMERSARLSAGTYVIKAQDAVSAQGISFRVDDWHLAVEKSA